MIASKKGNKREKTHPMVLEASGFHYLHWSFLLRIPPFSYLPVLGFFPSSRLFPWKFVNLLAQNPMGKMGLFDLERHFAFYGAYHSNPVNVFLHMLFVWPLFFTALVLFYFTPSFFILPQIGLLPSGFNHTFLLNFGFLFTLIYSLFYVLLDKKAGCLAALLCFSCWVGSSFLASYLGFSLAWKVWFSFSLNAPVGCLENNGKRKF